MIVKDRARARRGLLPWQATAVTGGTTFGKAIWSTHYIDILRVASFRREETVEKEAGAEFLIYNRSSSINSIILLLRRVRFTLLSSPVVLFLMILLAALIFASIGPTCKSETVEPSTHQP